MNSSKPASTPAPATPLRMLAPTTTDQGSVVTGGHLQEQHIVCCCACSFATAPVFTVVGTDQSKLQHESGSLLQIDTGNCDTDQLPS